MYFPFLSGLLLKKLVTNRCKFAIEWFICSHLVSFFHVMMGSWSWALVWNLIWQSICDRKITSCFIQNSSQQNNSFQISVNAQLNYVYIFLCCRWHSAPVLAGSLVFSIMIITLLLFTDRDSVSSWVHFLSNKSKPKNACVPGVHETT